MQPITLTAISGEPRVRDLDLAERLQMSNKYSVRTLIAAHRDEIDLHGELAIRKTESGLNGRPGKAYYLNEAQALTVCALARTPVAADMRRVIICGFMQWREEREASLRAKTVPVVAHSRRPPTRYVAPIDLRERLEGFFKAYRNQPDVLADWAAENIEVLESTLRNLTGYRSLT